MNYLNLLSGSDIRGIAETQLSDETLIKFSISYYEILNKTARSPLIIIGKDSRLSGERIAETIIKSLSALGAKINILYSGQNPVTTTPMVNESVRHYKADGGLMITASHLPKEWNGIKIFTPFDAFPKKELKILLDRMNQIDKFNFESQTTQNVNEVDFFPTYCEHLKEIIKSEANSPHNSKPLEGIKIVVDAGNGSCGFYADKILKPLGADVSNSLYLDPDGNFPNHIPNPENKDAIVDIRKQVLKSQADLGVIFDTDGDRSSLLLNDGTSVNRNKMLALVSQYTLEKHPRSTIVTDSVTSSGLTEFIKSRKGEHRRFKRGYLNIKNEMKKINTDETRCFVGGETSGHIMFYDNHYADDGSYTVSCLIGYYARLKSQNENFNHIFKNYHDALESKCLRLKIASKDFKEIGRSIINQITEWSKTRNYSIDTTEGIRFEAPEYSGWALIRLSLHEPLLVINLESDIPDGVEKILSEMNKHLKQYPEINL